MAEDKTRRPLQPGEFPPLRGMALVFLTIAIGLSSFMEILDMTIVNVSIPSIAGSLACQPFRRHLGDQLLPAGRRGGAAAGRLDRPPLRRSAHLRHLEPAVHRVQRDLRHGHHHAHADRRAPDAGRGVRTDDVGGAGAAAAQLPGAPARPGAGTVGHGGHRRAHRRPGAGRLDHRQPTAGRGCSTSIFPADCSPPASPGCCCASANRSA